MAQGMTDMAWAKNEGLAHVNAQVTMNANGVFTVSFGHDFMTCS